jgi:HPt (histidine-containing phosphotransfer) domain-containing protein
VTDAGDAGPGAPLDEQAIGRIRRIGGDALLRRMITAFLAYTPAHLETALTAAEPAVVAKAAHALKSSAGNLGVVRVGRLAEEIERRAGAGDASYVALRPSLAQAFAAGRRALERELGGLDA